MNATFISAATGGARIYVYSDRGYSWSNTSSYLKTAGYTTYAYSDMNAATVYAALSPNKVIHISSHAGAGRMQLYGSFLSGIYHNTPSHYAINNYASLPTAKLIYFDGCETANYSSQYGYLDGTAYNKGADCTIAYEKPISSTNSSNGCNYFSMRLYYYACIDKRSIATASSYARSDLYSSTGLYYGTDSVCILGGTTTIY